MVEMFVEADPEDEDPQKTLTEVQLNFYESVVSGNLDLGAPIIDAMADNRVVKTSYMDENEDGKEGNIWDHLVHRKDVTGTKKDTSEE